MKESKFNFDFISSKYFKILLLALIIFSSSFLPIWKLNSPKISFRFFELFYPTFGYLVGGFAGSVAMIMGKLFYLLFLGKKFCMIKLLTSFFVSTTSIFVFSKKRLLNLIVPILAIIFFITDKVGAQAWPFAMYWIIPIVGHFFRDKSLFIRSLVTTFSAHAAGSLVWILAYNHPAEYWKTLIPIVAIERLTFALGISLSLIFVKNFILKNSLKLYFDYSKSLIKKYFESLCK